MTPLDRINLYTAHRQGIISRQERDERLAEVDVSGKSQSKARTSSAPAAFVNQIAVKKDK